jgi:hypothetical protein
MAADRLGYSAISRWTGRSSPHSASRFIVWIGRLTASSQAGRIAITQIERFAPATFGLGIASGYVSFASDRSRR